MTKCMPIVMIFALACDQRGIYNYEPCTDLTSVPYADADWNAKGAEQIIDEFSAIEVPTQVVWDQRTLEGPSASLALTISPSLDDARVIERQGAGCFVGQILQVPIVVDITIGANDAWGSVPGVIEVQADDPDGHYVRVLGQVALSANWEDLALAFIDDRHPDSKPFWELDLFSKEPWPVTRLGLDATDHDAGYTSVLWGGNTEVSAPEP